MKNEKGKNLFLKIVLIAIIVGIIVFIIMNIVKFKNSKEGVGQNNQKQNSESQQVGENVVKEEFVQQTDDGTKVNVGSKITDDKDVNGLKFTNVQLTEKNNQSTLLADVENATGKDIKDYTNLGITFLTKDGQEIFNTIRADFLKTIDYVEILGLAKDGQEEYDMIKELKPDIVITDNQMPYMNGIDVIEKVKNDNEIINKPCFVIVSADGLYEYRTKMDEYNILDIINKSIGFDGINNRIKENIDMIRE